MFMVFRHHVSVAAFTAMMADMVLCFVAIVLAAGTLEGTRSAYPLQLYQVVLTGAQFALIISLMYSFAGLYRPTPIALPAKLMRTVIALVVGSYLTYLMLLIVAEPEYVKLLIGSALMYSLVGVVFVRSGLYFLRHVATRKRVLIVGTGAEAYAVAGDLKALKRASNDVVGFYPTSDAVPHIDSNDDAPLSVRESQLGHLDGPLPSPKVFSREATIGELVERHRIDEIIVAEREQRGAACPWTNCSPAASAASPSSTWRVFTNAPRAKSPWTASKPAGSSTATASCRAAPARSPNAPSTSCAPASCSCWPAPSCC